MGVTSKQQTCRRAIASSSSSPSHSSLSLTQPASSPYHEVEAALPTTTVQQRSQNGQWVLAFTGATARTTARLLWVGAPTATKSTVAKVNPRTYKVKVYPKVLATQQVEATQRYLGRSTPA